MTGIVSRPHAKNSKNITTKAWYTLGSPIPELWNAIEDIFFIRKSLSVTFSERERLILFNLFLLLLNKHNKWIHQKSTTNISSHISTTTKRCEIKFHSIFFSVSFFSANQINYYLVMINISSEHILKKKKDSGKKCFSNFRRPSINKNYSRVCGCCCYWRRLLEEVVVVVEIVTWYIYTLRCRHTYYLISFADRKYTTTSKENCLLKLARNILARIVPTRGTKKSLSFPMKQISLGYTLQLTSNVCSRSLLRFV